MDKVNLKIDVIINSCAAIHEGGRVCKEVSYRITHLPTGFVAIGSSQRSALEELEKLLQVNAL